MKWKKLNKKQGLNKTNIYIPLMKEVQRKAVQGQPESSKVRLLSFCFSGLGTVSLPDTESFLVSIKVQGF